MKKLTPLLCAALILEITSCSVAEPKVSRTEYVMGTIVNITVYGDSKNSADALDAAFRRLYEIEKIFSYTDPESELSRLNAAAPSGESVKVSDELFSLIKEGLRCGAETDGAFDITLGALIDLWGVDGDSPRVPAQEEIEALLPYVGYENVVLDEENSEVAFLNGHIRIHLGGIVKGYAAEQLLLDMGGASVIADLGGDMALAGTPPNKNAWRIGIADPDDADGIVMTLEIPREKARAAIMTSGTYQRFFEQDGRRYHHILDPKTGYPARSGIVSATVTAPLGSGAYADAFATAIIVKGEEFARERVPGAVLITDGGEVIPTGGYYYED